MPLLVIILSAVIVGIDQLIKYFVYNFLKPVGSVDVIPGLFSLDYVENKGAAFGMMANMRWVFIVFTIVVIAIILYVVFKKKITNKLFIASAILLIGGGIGNLIDRIFLGFVIDYLSVSFFPPVCNFADYCITIGTVLLLVYLLFFSDYFKSNKKDKLNEQV